MFTTKRKNCEYDDKNPDQEPSSPVKTTRLHVSSQEEAFWNHPIGQPLYDTSWFPVDVYLIIFKYYIHCQRLGAVKRFIGLFRLCKRLKLIFDTDAMWYMFTERLSKSWGVQCETNEIEILFSDANLAHEISRQLVTVTGANPRFVSTKDSRIYTINSILLGQSHVILHEEQEEAKKTLTEFDIKNATGDTAIPYAISNRTRSKSREKLCLIYAVLAPPTSKEDLIKFSYCAGVIPARKLFSTSLSTCGPLSQIQFFREYDLRSVEQSLQENSRDINEHVRPVLNRLKELKRINDWIMEFFFKTYNPKHLHERDQEPLRYALEHLKEEDHNKFLCEIENAKGSHGSLYVYGIRASLAARARESKNPYAIRLGHMPLDIKPVEAYLIRRDRSEYVSMEDATSLDLRQVEISHDYVTVFMVVLLHHCIKHDPFLLWTINKLCKVSCSMRTAIYYSTLWSILLEEVILENPQGPTATNLLAQIGVDASTFCMPDCTLTLAENACIAKRQTRNLRGIPCLLDRTCNRFGEIIRTDDFTRTARNIIPSGRWKDCRASDLVYIIATYYQVPQDRIMSFVSHSSFLEYLITHPHVHDYIIPEARFPILMPFSHCGTMRDFLKKMTCNPAYKHVVRLQLLCHKRMDESIVRFMERVSGYYQMRLK